MLLVATLALAGCATRSGDWVSQTGTVRSMDEDRSIYTELIRTCEAVYSLTTRVRVAGTVAKRRVNRSLWMGVDREALRVEPTDGLPFVLTTGGGQLDDAALRLPHERRAVAPPSRDLVHAILGVPVSGRELSGWLTGCPRPSGPLYPFRIGDNISRLAAGPDQDEFVDLRFERKDASASWRLTHLMSWRPGWTHRVRAQFSGESGQVPRTVRLTSVAWNGSFDDEFDLTLTLDRLQLNVLPAPELFSPPVPPTDTRITLDELRTSRTRLPLILD